MISDNPTPEILVHQFFEALNGNDASGLPLTDQVEYLGTMLPEPVRGREAVISHLNEIAPFIASVRADESVIVSSRAAVISHIEGINGVRFTGSYFFRFEDSRISRIQAIFDTRPLLKGRSV